MHTHTHTIHLLEHCSHTLSISRKRGMCIFQDVRKCFLFCWWVCVYICICETTALQYLCFSFNLFVFVGIVVFVLLFWLWCMRLNTYSCTFSPLFTSMNKCWVLVFISPLPAFQCHSFLGHCWYDQSQPQPNWALLSLSDLYWLHFQVITMSKS